MFLTHGKLDRPMYEHAERVHQLSAKKHAAGKDGRPDQYLRAMQQKVASDLVKHVTDRSDLDQALLDLGWTHVSQSIDAAHASQLLAKYGIPVHLAKEFGKDFSLKNVTIWKIKKERQKDQEKWKVEFDPDGNVATRDISLVLREAVDEAELVVIEGNARKQILVKIALDGAQHATNRSVGLQTCILSFPGQKSVEDAMSPSGGKIIWAMKGTEDDESYREGLKPLAAKLENLLEGKGLDGELDAEADFITKLVLDMKSLVMFLGLGAVWSINSTYGCPYCNQLRNELHKGCGVKRTTDQVNQFRAKAEASSGTLDGKNNLGYTHAALLKFPAGKEVLDICPVDLLHLILNVAKKLLLSMLAYIADKEKNVINEVVEFLKSFCDVYVHTSVKIGKGLQKKVATDLKSRVENAIWRRKNWLKLLIHSPELMAILARAEQWKERPSDLELWKKIWERSVEMFAALQVDIHDQAEMKRVHTWRTEYTKRAAELGNWLFQLEGASGFTTYIHIWLYHCGELIERGYDFARCANYDIEGVHLVIKQQTKGSTGQKTFPKLAIAAAIRNETRPQHTSRKKVKEKQLAERDDDARAPKKRRGRPPKAPEEKSPLHSMRPVQKRSRVGNGAPHDE